jgi:hypothetical protein
MIFARVDRIARFTFLGVLVATLLIVAYVKRSELEALGSSFLEMSDGSSAAVSPANKGRLIYNSGTQTFQMSMNGGAYASIGTGGGGGTPSISFATTTGAIGTVNLSTLGTFDWYSPVGALSSGLLATSAASTVAHAKAYPSGGFPSLYNTVQTFNAGLVSFIASTVGGDTYQSTAIDDQTQSALNAAANQYAFLFTSGAAVEWGFRIQVPATLTSRKLRIYANAASCLITTTATLSLSGTTATTTFDTTTALDAVVTATFTGGVQGDQLVVTQVCTTSHGGTPQLGFAGASLGPI